MCAKFSAVPMAAALVLLGPLPVPAQDSTRIGVAEQIRTITSRIKSAEDRKQAEKALRHLDAATVLEMIFPELERLGEDPDTWAGFKGYFSPDEESPQPLQGYRILQELWSDRIREQSTNHGALLLKLLKTASRRSKDSVVNGFWYHYVPEAEAPLAVILRDQDYGWPTSANVLLHHHPKKYGPVLLDRVENEKEPLSTRRAAFHCFDVGRFKRMEEKDRKRFVRAGFALLEAERRAHPDYKGAGYHLSGRIITDFLKIELPWPSVTDPKYRMPGSLNVSDAFFEDTVRVALAWWKTHRKDYDPGCGCAGS